MSKHSEFSQKIGYTFKSAKLIEEAFTHPSCLGLGPVLSAQKSYERLEFLGDAILTFIITELLIKNFPKETEGQLTKRRATLIKGGVLVRVGKEIEILNHLITARSIGAFNESESFKITEDMTEALLGAIYLDGGMQACKKFVIQYWTPFLFKEIVPDDDPKTYVQEWSQKRGFGLPKYNLISKSGTAHAPIFTIEVAVANLPTFSASSVAKKLAEKAAAKALIEYIKSNYTDE